ncbi:hypothetical protein CHLNCDRAFT_136634 [Chlorella variabilis]|uniref:Uncharacterized protein n=1 Tax=Chlorella variabilis TaxID=554065 RepID=E1ZKQ6_CHLVA|nr:hypothetical protein CHLNCDRAFT_136634 [Chlorella variabilis]EFN53422.1 hypothetical protein CHLNCDRAFT_136634 [Chlorella variabilis]|eukprot:XP_005845524.1 hypothetical protein CHLNCDRAFT_136634 [Chlorella variabilis]
MTASDAPSASRSGGHARLVQTAASPRGDGSFAVGSTDLEQVAEQAVVDAVAQTAGDRATSSSAAAGSREVDPIKEGSRKYRRTVYDFENWRQHRSTKRYMRHAKGLLGSRIFRGLASPLLYILAVSASVAVWNTLVETGLAPDVLPELHMSNNGPFGLTSFALSLLLVTNASYARWLDARKAWGMLVNRSRDITRQALTCFPAADRPLLDMLCRWTAAYSRALMCHVREDSDLEAELRKVLPAHEVEAVVLAKHRPNYCLQVMSEIVHSAHLSALPLPVARGAVVASGAPALAAAGWEGTRYRMDENLTAMEDILGACERILRAPIPLSYTRHTSRFMMIWLTLLPFSLWDNCGWASVPLCGIIAFLLLGIEEIGVSIEEPFSILPLEVICDIIEANVRELRSIHAGSHAEDGSQPRRAPAARDLVGRAVAEAEQEEAAAAAGTVAAAAGA